MKKDCWWNESAKSGKDTACLETPIASVANTTLVQCDEGEVVPANPAQWLYSVTKHEPSHNEFLVDSGAPTCVCQEPGRKTQRT